MTIEIIPPSEIQIQLDRIWESLEGSNKVRASLFNLIFFTEKKERSEYIREVSQNVIEKFPSRVIFISSDTSSEKEYLNTSVSILSANIGENDVACDLIEIDVAGKFQKQVPFVILPHILPDLPIYVIWAEPPTLSSPLFTQIQRYANRIIFDSEAVEDLSEFAQNLLQIEKTTHCDIADLNWARIESWRDLLASTFYSPERLHQLNKSTKIQIFYNACESPFIVHCHVQALYLQGWISTQLDWKLEKSQIQQEKITFSYKREKGNVEVTLYPENQEHLKRGTILSVDIETEDQNHFSFGRSLEIPHHVQMRFSTLEKCDIPLQYIFAKDESGHSLVREICHRKTSKHYLKLLQKIKEQKGVFFS